MSDISDSVKEGCSPDDGDRTAADLSGRNGEAGIDKWTPVDRKISADNDPLTVLRDLQANELTKELMDLCLGISDEHPQVIDLILAKIDAEKFPLLLATPSLRKLPGLFFKMCRDLVQKGLSSNEGQLIDITLELINESGNSSEAVFNGFKLLGAIGSLSEEHLALVRNRGHDIRKIARNFPIPEWLSIVAWNL